MNLLERRRAMMGTKVEPEAWDYILYPANGETVGQIACKKIPMTMGQTATIESMCAVPSPSGPYVYSSTGYIYDGRSGVGGGYLFAEKKNAGKKITATYTATNTGNLTIACVNAKSEGFVDATVRDCFYGYYIKIRIT